MVSQTNMFQCGPMSSLDVCAKENMEAVNQRGFIVTTYRHIFPPRTYLTDSSAVVFSEGVVDPAAIVRRTRRLEVSESQSHAPNGGPCDVPEGRYPYPCRRRLQSVSATAMATVTISNMQFNAYGSPSSAAEAAVTSITVTKTGDGEVCLSPFYFCLLAVSASTTLSRCPRRLISIDPCPICSVSYRRNRAEKRIAFRIRADRYRGEDCTNARRAAACLLLLRMYRWRIYPT